MARSRDKSDFLSQAAAFPPGALLGLDLGTRTIGVASANPERTLASPVTTIKRLKFGADAEEVMRLAAERKAVGLVVGLPLNMDGSEGPRAQSARAFVRNLARAHPLPCAFWDERLSTVAAERELIAMDTKRAKRARVIDAHAAAYILQGALDRLAAARESARDD